eukprot:scaffold4548_cov22-Tisochrysis_lutea.AAC.1
MRADVWDFKQTLTQCMGFDEGNIAIMIDTDQQYTQPTGKNIKAHLSKMVTEAQDGDLLVDMWVRMQMGKRAHVQRNDFMTISFMLWP